MGNQQPALYSKLNGDEHGCAASPSRPLSCFQSKKATGTSANIQKNWRWTRGILEERWHVHCTWPDLCSVDCVAGDIYPASEGWGTTKNQNITPARAMHPPKSRKAYPHPYCTTEADNAEPMLLPTEVWAFQIPMTNPRCSFPNH